MAASLIQKLRITEGTTIVAVNAPANYRDVLGILPTGATIKKSATKDHAFVHLFVRDRTELETWLPKVKKTLAPEGLLWICYPKGSKTDLNRDSGWDATEGLNMRWMTLIAFNEEWSAFLLMNTMPKAPSKASTDYHAALAEWVDAKTKTVRIPEDLYAAFEQNPKANALFEALSYTDRKEYVLWVVGAKQRTTRDTRVKGTVDKLLAGRKNPADR
jgi:hypothetical protein